MTIINKLTNILSIKNEIKEAIKSKNINMDNVSFNAYPSKIDSITSNSDTTHPIIEYFYVNTENFISHFFGKTESTATISLTSPNNKNIPIVIKSDGTFSGVDNSPVAGIYTLRVIDIAGNVSTATKSIILHLSDAEVNSLIASIYSNGAKGHWFDINDMSTLYQDAAMTIPVTAVNQTVYAVKSKNNNGRYLISRSASACPKLQYDSINNSYYLLYDGIDDAFGGTSSPTITVNTSNITYFYNITLIQPKDSTFVLLRSPINISVYRVFGSLLLRSSYSNNTYDMYEISQISPMPAKLNMVLKYNTKSADIYKINNITINAPAKNIDNFITMHVSEEPSTLATIQKAFYGFISFDKHLTSEQQYIIEKYMAKKSGIAINE